MAIVALIVPVPPAAGLSGRTRGPEIWRPKRKWCWRARVDSATVWASLGPSLVDRDRVGYGVCPRVPGWPQWCSIRTGLPAWRRLM